MPRYVALLRGINVGGNTMIKMEELRTMFEALNFSNVKSYINSGNIAFDTRKKAESSLVKISETAIEKQFGRHFDVIVREQKTIHDILANNPFKGQYDSHKEMHVLFLREDMPADKIELFKAASSDRESFVVRGREIYCYLRQGFADSLLTKGFLDKKLKVLYTARNWRTVEKLALL
jgi:uncharacterized protein (DUF1697 family)